MKTINDDLKFVSAQALLIDELCRQLGIVTVAGKCFVAYSLANAMLMDKKQIDYGAGNIAKFGADGCLVRMNDKIERLVNLMKKKRKPRNESVQDSYRDIANYSTIALMCLNNEWPKE